LVLAAAAWPLKEPKPGSEPTIYRYCLVDSYLLREDLVFDSVLPEALSWSDAGSQLVLMGSLSSRSMVEVVGWILQQQQVDAA
jgi:hypothetical protein